MKLSEIPTTVINALNTAYKTVKSIVSREKEATNERYRIQQQEPLINAKAGYINAQTRRVDIESLDMLAGIIEKRGYKPVDDAVDVMNKMKGIEEFNKMSPKVLPPPEIDWDSEQNNSK